MQISILILVVLIFVLVTCLSGVVILQQKAYDISKNVELIYFLLQKSVEKSD